MKLKSETKKLPNVGKVASKDVSRARPDACPPGRRARGRRGPCLAARRLERGAVVSASWRGKIALAEADALPGHYFVTARDELGRTAFLLGPFTQTRPGKTAHVKALGLLRVAKKHVLDNYARSIGWTFGTARIPITPEPPPVGKLNEALGMATKET